MIEFINQIFRSARFRRYAMKVQAKRIVKQDRESTGRLK